MSPQREPTLDELLSDPMICQLMARDGADPNDVHTMLLRIAERKKKPNEVSEFEMLFDTYKAALGTRTSGSTEQ